MTERAHAVSPVAKFSGAIRNFAATAKSRPLGEGGCERSEQTEGVFLSVKIQARKVRRLSGLVLIKNNFSAEYAQSKRGAHSNRQAQPSAFFLRRSLRTSLRSSSTRHTTSRTTVRIRPRRIKAKRLGFFSSAERLRLSSTFLRSCRVL